MLDHSNKTAPKRQFGDHLAEQMKISGQVTASEQSISLLKLLDPHGWHNLVMIRPDSTVVGKTFPPDSWKEIASWIDERDGQGNLYYSVNEPKPNAANTKLGKEAIANVRAIWFDVDPQNKSPDELDAARTKARQNAERLTGSPTPPSALVDSGGGYQGLLVLKDKLPVTGEQDWAPIEDQVRGIAKIVQGDMSVADVSQLLRLPGTMNLPNAKKRAEGRLPRRGALIDVREYRYVLDEISSHHPPEAKQRVTNKNSGADIIEINGLIDMQVVTGAVRYTELEHGLREKFENALARDADLQSLWATGETRKPDKSASARRFALAAELKAWRFSVNEFGALAWVWDHAINAGEDPSEKITEYEIARAWIRSPRLPIKEWAWLEPDVADETDDERSDGTSKPTKDEKRTFKLVSFQEVAARDATKAAAPLVKGLLQQGAFSVLYGESNTGKTFVAMDLAFHIAAGMSWDGMKVSSVPVLFVAAEGSYGAELRVKALQRKFPREADDAKFDLLLSGVDLFRRDEDLVPLVEAVRSRGARFVVLDTLSRVLAGGDENSSTDMGALVRNIDALRHATDAHVMAVHHSGKNRDRGARGHSLLRAAIDTEIEIADNAITVTKQRDLDKSFSRAFVLEPVSLFLDEDGEAVTSCTIRLISKNELPPKDITETEAQIVDAMIALSADHNKAALKVKDITECLEGDADPKKEEAVRSRLRALEVKRVVERAGRGLWRLTRAGKWSTALCDDGAEGSSHKWEPVEIGRRGSNDIFE